MAKLSVVDLFAGPGGLGEGFSSIRAPTGEVFRILVSIEKDPAAHRTLRFRAFCRRALERGIPLDISALDPRRRDAESELLEEMDSSELNRQWKAAEQEAVCAELGNADHAAMIEEALGRVTGHSVLIGGPPCQAYSVVGRARNRGVLGYAPEEDGRHFLYEQYVKILSQLRPVAFVMENVKGLLSAQVRTSGVFRQILRDLRGSGYTLYPLAPRNPEPREDPDPRDFVIRSEDFGVPQSRHRVILFGVRSDQITALEGLFGEELAILIPRFFGNSTEKATLSAVLSGMPPLRSHLSQRSTEPGGWHRVVRREAEAICFAPDLEVCAGGAGPAAEIREVVKRAVAAADRLPEVVRGQPSQPPEAPEDLREWLFNGRLAKTFNHEARGHMAGDLGRYLYAAAFAKVKGASPKAPDDFPRSLAPNHANWASGKFADRFRVQLAESPATTVTSHIAKDGHYYIHPDPEQVRSLTVREAARLQTFPDDYIFFGNRTQQYTQVGNAVPPFLARRIAAVVAQLFCGAEVKLEGWRK